MCYGYERIWDLETRKFSRNAPSMRRCVRRNDSYFVNNHQGNQRLTQRQLLQRREPPQRTGSPT
ncbi:hypothetical protein, partial [Trichormus variabilis]|uniref:hypothetical protein n=1 Tax=Anabaena variabilis TaxID=264691 RepID=UPI001A923DDE